MCQYFFFFSFPSQYYSSIFSLVHHSQKTKYVIPICIQLCTVLHIKQILCSSSLKYSIKTA
jgi:hypothetical protein